MKKALYRKEKGILLGVECILRLKIRCFLLKSRRTICRLPIKLNASFVASVVFIVFRIFTESRF